MTQELVQIDHTELATPARPMGSDEYRDTVKEAGEKAQVLAEVVESCNLYAIISGRKYLTVEAWQTIGVGYGITARIEWTRELDGGGWEARAVAVDASNVVRAAAECEAGRPDDKAWDSRPAYQQRSMAQTRAISKALRSCLSWVVVLAGYAPTPAEEMPREADMIQNSRQASPQKMATRQIPTQAANECPLHAGEFFEFIDGFGGKPGEWKHKNGLHPDGPEPWAGKNKWCKQASKEVQNAMGIVTVVTQAPVQPELLPVDGEDKDDEQY